MIQASKFDLAEPSWQLQQEALPAASEVELRQEVAAAQAAVEAQRTAQLADWAAQEQEITVKHHQVMHPLQIQKLLMYIKIDT